jgi:hypothetical protein
LFIFCHYVETMHFLPLNLENFKGFIEAPVSVFRLILAVLSYPAYLSYYLNYTFHITKAIINDHCSQSPAMNTNFSNAHLQALKFCTTLDSFLSMCLVSLAYRLSIILLYSPAYYRIRQLYLLTNRSGLL